MCEGRMAFHLQLPRRPPFDDGRPEGSEVSESGRGAAGGLYVACLQSQRGSFGLTVSGHGDLPFLLILDIQGSEAVKGWNEEHPQCAIAAGHVVVEANGARTPGQMLEHFRQDKVAG